MSVSLKWLATPWILCSAVPGAECCNSCHEDDEEFNIPLSGDLETFDGTEFDVQMCCKAYAEWKHLPYQEKLRIAKEIRDGNKSSAEVWRMWRHDVVGS